jgi:hypothetical protein
MRAHVASVVLFSCAAIFYVMAAFKRDLRVDPLPIGHALCVVAVILL